jgi:hypothetical protein
MLEKPFLRWRKRFSNVQDNAAPRQHIASERGMEHFAASASA